MRCLLYFVLLLTVPRLHAQKQNHTQPVIAATILSPGLSAEMPITDKLTIKARAAFTVGWSYSFSSSLGQSSSLTPTALAAAQLRYYYNFPKRTEKGKLTARNSANYLSLLTKYSFANKTFYYSDNGNYTVSGQISVPDAGIVWGLQRNFNNRFSIDCSVGPSIYAALAYNNFSLIADISLGIWLGKKRS